MLFNARLLRESFVLFPLILYWTLPVGASGAVQNNHGEPKGVTESWQALDANSLMAASLCRLLFISLSVKD